MLSTMTCSQQTTLLFAKGTKRKRKGGEKGKFPPLNCKRNKIIKFQFKNKLDLKDRFLKDIVKTKLELTHAPFGRMNFIVDLTSSCLYIFVLLFL